MKKALQWDSRRAERGFFTLIGLLIVIVIIVILFSMYAGGPVGGPTPEGGATTVLGGAKQRAEDVLCQNNLSQLRTAISIYRSTAGTNPPSLRDLDAGVSLTCPVGGEPYQYDPRSGRVGCPHTGHERF
jgi:type II secretory pathway pseudopilin PulG